MNNQKIQWFPGHMHKARKQIEEIIPKTDIIVEILDARIPFSSKNPLIRHLRKDKSVIKVLNKRDLADPAMTALWLKHLEKEQGTKTMAITTTQITEVNKIIDLCHSIFPNRRKIGKHIHALIVGIPNVGKSTIINMLARRVVAKTGNEPAITRQQQRVKLESGIVLSDTPGILWPKLENPNTGYRLAATGAVKDTVVEYDEVAFYIVEYLANTYPDLLRKRYHIERLPDNAIELMGTIGQKRGCLRSGGRIDLSKASRILINELRNGVLGLITLEYPDIINKELLKVEETMAVEADKQIRRKKERRQRYLKNKR
ncbi:ribosome biogenesis GTPase YlqF [Candidatus Enterovibrio escicola]|uniref:ribosome biogenesis GTPase YlqF n=1 Tax=Candidatus Enterovibrio escicola TaxID=1927127 RepID=UPI0012380F3A|nr:ribosome biogenesis GTPase YlqF [Candidatus Enterovibrio escacola]